MPRNVRNAWVTVDADGRRKPIATGPRAKNGAVRVSLDVRRKGEVHRALEVEVTPNLKTDEVTIRVRDASGQLVYTATYDR